MRCNINGPSLRAVKPLPQRHHRGAALRALPSDLKDIFTSAIFTSARSKTERDFLVAVDSGDISHANHLVDVLCESSQVRHPALQDASRRHVCVV